MGFSEGRLISNRIMDHQRKLSPEVTDNAPQLVVSRVTQTPQNEVASR